jgi:hypothetical protein
MLLFQGVFSMASQPYKRTRSQGGFVHVPNTELWWHWPVCNVPTQFINSFPCMQIGTLRTTEDVVTPGYRKLSRQGKIIISPYKSVVETQQGTGLYGRVRHPKVFCAATLVPREHDVGGPVGYLISHGGNQYRLSPVSLITDAEISAAISVAATQAWEKSAGHLAGVLQDVAEMRQTLSMFTRPLSSIQPLLRSMNKSKTGFLKKGVEVGNASFSSARNLWLQYRYGIRPLVSSVQGILKALEKTGGKSRETFRGSYSLNRSGSSPGSFTAWDLTCQYADDSTDLVEIRTGLIMEGGASLPQKLGVDASGLLTLPWELVPFSFVADWFLNVGSFLGALVPALSKDPLGSWVTVRRKQTRLWYITSTAAILPATDYVMVRPAQENRYATWLTTTRTPGLPLPKLTRKPDALTKVFSDLRMVDSFALAAQQMGRLLKS